MFIFTSLLAGLVFGLGLIVSGMANPAKVLGFLDLTGAWDPSLALVMAGAIAVSFFAFLFARNRTRSLIGADMKLPGARQIDRRLVIGSTLFGIGWGVAGFAPAPAWSLWAWARSKHWFSWLPCWSAWSCLSFLRSVDRLALAPQPDGCRLCR